MGRCGSPRCPRACQGQFHGPGLNRPGVLKPQSQNKHHHADSTAILYVGARMQHRGNDAMPATGQTTRRRGNRFLTLWGGSMDLISTAPNYTEHWDEKFRGRSWGRYPPEDLVRFMGRRFRAADKGAVKVLEVGCGPGANLWFMHREGFAVHGIDISPTAIAIANARLANENAGIPSPAADLRVGHFARLPWPDGHFDLVVDIFALYANTTDVIGQTLAEIARVLKPVALFFARAEIDTLFGGCFQATAIDRVIRSDVGAHQQIEEFHCQFTRARR